MAYQNTRFLGNEQDCVAFASLCKRRGLFMRRMTNRLIEKALNGELQVTTEELLELSPKGDKDANIGLEESKVSELNKFCQDNNTSVSKFIRGVISLFLLDDFCQEQRSWTKVEIIRSISLSLIAKNFRLIQARRNLQQIKDIIAIALMEEFYQCLECNKLRLGLRFMSTILAENFYQDQEVNSSKIIQGLVIIVFKTCNSKANAEKQKINTRLSDTRITTTDAAINTEITEKEKSVLEEIDKKFLFRRSRLVSIIASQLPENFLTPNNQGKESYMAISQIEKSKLSQFSTNASKHNLLSLLICLLDEDWTKMLELLRSCIAKTDPQPSNDSYIKVRIPDAAKLKISQAATTIGKTEDIIVKGLVQTLDYDYVIDKLNQKGITTEKITTISLRTSKSDANKLKEYAKWIGISRSLLFRQLLLDYLSKNTD